jgi:hypothetical protein
MEKAEFVKSHEYHAFLSYNSKDAGPIKEPSLVVCSPTRAFSVRTRFADAVVKWTWMEQAQEARARVVRTRTLG